MTVSLAKSHVHAGDHVVLFYDRESELVQSVGSFIAEAAGEDGAAVVIATQAHVTAVTAQLEAAGVDTARGRERGTLMFLDAAETMAGFTVAGRLDPDAFRREVGGVLRAAAKAGGAVPVRAYGEMVGLLWDAGDVLGTIELERLWNELAREVEFALLCAYQTDSVSSPEHAGALQEVCHLHSSVIAAPSGDELSGVFLPERDAPAAARHFAEPALRSWGLSGSALDDAQVVLSELTTNAVMHARSPFSLTVRSEDSCIRILVTDRSRVLPQPHQTGPSALSARGLHLVDALAADWGVDVSAMGKTVWATLAL